MLQDILSIRVYYEDTDAGGIVYHANYLKFFERARTETLRNRGFELNNLLSDYDTQFVVHNLQVEFLQPARLDQLLYVITEVVEVRRASLMFHQKIQAGSQEGSLLVKANVHVACLDKALRPRPIPDILLQEIKR